jgi:hypothetical protein
MSLGNDIGRETMKDVNQYVHSWIDDLRRLVEEMLKAADTRRVKITIEIEPK